MTNILDQDQPLYAEVVQTFEKGNHKFTYHVEGRTISFEMLYDKHWDGVLIYETDVFDTMMRFVKPGDCVIDGGANQGYFSLLLSELVGDEGLVLAFEPDPVNVVTLRKNVLLNKRENIYSFYQALWSEDCYKEFYPAPAGHKGYSSFLEFKEAEPPVLGMARSLDSLLVSPKVSNPKLIKLDCEGAEFAILKGAERMLRRGVACIVVELNFYLLPKFGVSIKQITDFMCGLGYDMFILEGGFKPTYVPPNAVIQTAEIGHINVMFSRKELVDTLWAKPLQLAI